MLGNEFKKYLSEYMATFALVFCGTGAIVVNYVSGNVVSHLGVGMTFGLIVMAMIYSFGPISGAHLNPAVTFAFWLSGRFPLKNLIPYIISQLLGAVSASLLLKFLFPDSPSMGMTQPSSSIIQTFVMETVLTFILMLVIIQTSTGSKEMGVFAGLGIGSTVMLEAIFAGPISGASMNPARSFAPALVSNDYNHLWLYILAPTLGASIAIFVWKALRDRNDDMIYKIEE